MTAVEQCSRCGRPDSATCCSEPPPPKKRSKGTSPTQRTLAECRKRGWIAGVVEQFVRFPPPGHKIDLFGVIDIIAIAPESPLHERPQIVAIQATSGLTGGNHATRRAKILAEPRARAWVEAGGRLELWSWSKRGDRGKRKLWALRVEAFTLESWRPAEALAAIGAEPFDPWPDQPPGSVVLVGQDSKEEP